MNKAHLLILLTVTACVADGEDTDLAALTPAGLPAPPTIPPTNALLQKGFLDATLYPGVDRTGHNDSRAGLQAAIDDGYRYAIPVYLPSGTYRLTGPLSEAQLLKTNNDQYRIPFTPQGSMTQSAMLVGATTPSRPRLVLDPHASGFGSATAPKAVLDFHAKDAANAKTEEQIAPSGFGLIVRNLEIDVGDGNPGAVGLQVPSAQMSHIEDVKIDATGGYAGLRWVVSVNTMVNIEVTGGQYGVIADTCCGVNLTGLTLRDQTKAGLVVNSSTTVVVDGFSISETTATPIAMTSGSNVRGELSLHDGQISSSGTTITNTYARTLYMQNVFVKTGGSLVTNGSAAVAIPTGSWQNVAEYVFTEKPGTVGRNNGTTFTASTSSLVDGTLAPRSGLTLGPAAAPPAGLTTLHSWTKLPWFDDADAHDAHALGVKGDGITDDTAALQAAIDAHDKIFLPRGDYVLSAPLRLHAHTKLFGPPSLGTRLCPTWSPNGALTHAVVTDNAPTGDAYLGNIGIKLRTGYANSFMGGLDWKIGRKSLVNQLTVYVPYEDPNGTGAQVSAARSLVAISGGGGGRWYGLTMMDPVSRSSNHGARTVAISNTTEPLTFYGANLEHNRGDYSVEIANASNVRMYSSKTENDVPFIYCHGSHNLLLTGIINREDQVLESDSCDGVLAPNIQDFSWELGGPVIREKYGTSTVTFPLLTQSSLFKRGTYHASAFTGTTTSTATATACAASTTPTIDGDAADWGSVPRMALTSSALVQGTVGGDADVSARYATQWRGTTLYVLVEVTDDAVAASNTSTTQLSNNDSVELYLDGDATRSTSYTTHAFQLTVDASNRHGGMNASGATFTSASKRTATGYTVEYAIPFATLAASTSAPIGFDIAINDNDQGDGARDGQLFLVGTAASWSDPSSWGTLDFATTTCTP